MGKIRIKTMFKDDRILNDFLSLKDIEFKKLHVRPMEYIIEYEKVKKTTKKVA